MTALLPPLPLASAGDVAAEIVVQLGSVSVARPATVFTNVLLSGQCVWMARRARSVGWRSFFAWLAVGAFLGAFKHGFHHTAPVALHQLLTASSNVSLGLAVASAQAAVLPGWAALPPIQAVATVGVNLWTRSFGATVTVLVLGMLPVLARLPATRPLGTRALRTAGWAVCAAAGAAWAVGWAPARWFDQTDLAHLVLMAGLALVYFSDSWSPAPGAEPEPTQEPSWT